MPASTTRTVERATDAPAASALRLPVQERVVAATDLAPEASPRPPARSPDLSEGRSEALPRRAETEPRDITASAGNAERTARAGAAIGRRDAEAARGATRPTDTAARAGNAVASDYPGVVMRHVSRVRRPNIAARGVARVTFRIAGSGALLGARLSRSSGSAALDRAALTVIRRAAPFPPPPAATARSFTVEIRGR
jgi:protein TonB